MAKGADPPEMDDMERHVVTLLARAQAEVRAPEALRARIDASRPSRGMQRTRRAAYGGVLAGALAVLVLALVLVLPGGTPGAPSLSQAAALGRLAPSAAAPVPDGHHPLTRLARDVEEVYFPNWSSLQWRAVGQRVDRIDGRMATTVYYEWHGTVIAYTIVAAPALGQPSTPVTSMNGIAFRTLTLGGRTVVTWRRSGHTCVLSGGAVDAATLRGLASWRAAG